MQAGLISILWTLEDLYENVMEIDRQRKDERVAGSFDGNCSELLPSRSPVQNNSPFAGVAIWPLKTKA